MVDLSTSCSLSHSCVYSAGFSHPLDLAVHCLPVRASEPFCVTPTEMSVHETWGALVNIVMTDGSGIEGTSAGVVRGGLCSLVLSFSLSPSLFPLCSSFLPTSLPLFSQICSGAIQHGKDSECQNPPASDTVPPGPHKLHITQRSQPPCFLLDISNHHIWCQLFPPSQNTASPQWAREGKKNKWV